MSADAAERHQSKEATMEECRHHEAIRDDLIRLRESDEAQWDAHKEIAKALSEIQLAQVGINSRIDLHLAEERMRLAETERHSQKGFAAITERAAIKALELGIVALLAWAVLAGAKAMGG